MWLVHALSRLSSPNVEIAVKSTALMMRGNRRVNFRPTVITGLAVIFAIPLFAYAAGSEESGWGWVETIGRWFNLLVLFGVIFYFARKPVSQFFLNRRGQIKKEISEAHAAREEAEHKLVAMELRMRDLETELGVMRQQAEEEAENEKARTLDQAGEESRKIVATAQREIEGLTRAARQDLRDYAVKLSLEIATRKIAGEMDSAARDDLIDRFLVKLTKAGREGQ